MKLSPIGMNYENEREQIDLKIFYDECRANAVMSHNL